MSKYDVPLDFERDHISAMLMERIRPASRVLEFGCAEGRMTRYMKEELGCSVSIVELDKEAYAVARQYADDGYCGDIESGEWAERFAGKKFDRVLFADVLEHLRRPDKALAMAGRFLTDDGLVLVSLPNIGHNDVLVNLYLNRFRYTPTGLLDDTHVHFWGKDDLEAFADAAGFSVAVLDGVYQAPFHTEQQVDRNEVPEALMEALDLRPWNQVYQFFLVLKKKGNDGAAAEMRLDAYVPPVSVNFYWDMGGGYTAEQYTSVTSVPMGGGVLRFRCDSVPSGCAHVRFDPPQGAPCMVSDVFVRTNMGSCELRPLNGTAAGKTIAFANTDPQMELAAPEGLRWIEVTAKIRQCRGQELCEVFTAVRDLQENVRGLSAQGESLRQENTRLTASLEGMTAESTQMHQTIQSLTEQHEVLEDQVKELTESLQDLTARNQLLQAHAKQAEERSADAESRAILAEERAADAESRAILAEERLQVIANSQSWRMTKPVRAVLDKAKQTSVGMLLHKTAHSLLIRGSATAREKIETNTPPEPPELPEPSGASEPQTELPTGEDPAAESAIGSLEEMGETIVRQGGAVYGPMGAVGKRPVLLVSHELNLTGAPVALEYLAESLGRKGYFPIVISWHDGKLRAHLTEHGITAAVYEPLYQSDLVAMSAHLFAFIVVCTNVGAPLVTALNGGDVPVLWWIHEAVASYHQGAVNAMPETLGDNVRVYCVGGYAEMALKRYFPAYEPRQLLYYVQDFAGQGRERKPFDLPNAKGKRVFALVGMQEERKGQDVLVQAVRMLPEQLLKECLFVFVGRTYYEPIEKMVDALCRSFPENALHIQEIDREEMFSFYDQIDCLICTSKDDPMPIVVTEAMVMGKAIICSENCGSAGILEQVDGGLIYRDNDPAALAGCIQDVCGRTGEELRLMGQRARQAYERFFSREVFDRNVDAVCSDVLSRTALGVEYPGTVSVVIPTFNGAGEVEPLIGLLQKQEGVGQVEVITVDSGSTDGTAEAAERAGATVIRIPNEEFSHSHARNLGASKASGEYILFMTQDARPNGSHWLNALLQPALTEGVAAVSCRESPKPDCDLLGRSAIWLHSRYMGVQNTDRILSMPSHPDYDTLRRNGQLNDVTCLVRRDVFEKFLYRGDYAEDLDLGLRLIRAGYRLALLSGVYTIHSHTRRPYYHFKRCLVDVQTLKKILPDMPVESLTEQMVVNRLVTGYCSCTLYLEALLERLECQEDMAAFCEWTDTQFNQDLKTIKAAEHDEIEDMLRRELPYTDKDLQAVILELFRRNGGGFKMDPAMVGDLSAYITGTLPVYLQESGEGFDRVRKQEIGDMVYKRFGQIAGTPLAYYCGAHRGEKTMLNELAARCSEGV